MPESKNGPERQNGSPELDAELQAESFVAETLKRAHYLHAQTFDTSDAAIEAQTAFVNKADESMATIPNIDKILFNISGSGVQVPLIDLEEAEAEGKLSTMALSIDEAVYAPLDQFSDVDALMLGIIGVVYREEESEQHHVSVRFLMQNAVPQVSTMSVEGLDYPVARMHVYRTFLVDANNNSIIKVSKLERQRESHKLAHELATSGMARTALRRKMNKLRNAFHHGDSDTFVELEDVALLREIGSMSNEHARKNLRNANLLSRALMDILGRGRELHLSGIPKGPEEYNLGIVVRGRVVDVLMPDTADDDMEPTLVIDSRQSNGESVLYQFPFTNISSLRF